MSSPEKKRKPHLIVKTWKRIHQWRKQKPRSSNDISTGCSIPALTSIGRSTSWYPLVDEEYVNVDKLTPSPVTPRGHIAVYVGEEKERFLIKTEDINHPMFRTLLDEAEKEFGFQGEGALVLPCKVASFRRTLWMLSADANRATLLRSPYKNYSLKHI